MRHRPNAVVTDTPARPNAGSGKRV